MNRLRARCRAAGVLLSLSLLIPCDTLHDGPRFLWQLAPDLRPVSTWALLAPAVAGALLLAATFLCERAVSLAILALAAIVGLLLLASAGALALAWDMLPEPDLARSAPLPCLLAIAWTASAVSLYPAPETRRAARALLVTAALAGAAYIALPAAGESPIRMLARVVSHVASASGRGNLLSAGLLSLVVSWPLLAVATGFHHARRPAEAPRSPMLVLAAYGAPLPLLPFARRAMADPWGKAGPVTVVVPRMVVLAAVLVVLACATTFLAEQAASLRERPPWTAALGALAVVVMAVAATSKLARPAHAISSLAVAPPTPEGDRLFGALLPGWNDARKKHDLGDPRATGQEAPDIPAAEAALVASARGLDAGLGGALSALASDASRADLLELRWYRLVERVNDASRRAGLPYYVDPTEVVVKDGDPPRRWFRLDTYRIEAIKRFSHAGGDLPLLHVRAMSTDRTWLSAMGISRDLQPFAVVVLDEIHAYQAELTELAARVPPRCGEGQGDGQADEDALRACGEVLSGFCQRGELGDALLWSTERHELQHQIDGATMARSAWLSRRLAWHAPPARARIERELSAYLAQTTAPGASPRVTLLRLLRMALLIHRGAEHEIALLAFEALGESGEPLASAYRRLSALDDEALRRRAAVAWREVYGGELATVSPP